MNNIGEAGIFDNISEIPAGDFAFQIDCFFHSFLIPNFDFRTLGIGLDRDRPVTLVLIFAAAKS
jgi:hypothetical protein